MRTHSSSKVRAWLIGAIAVASLVARASTARADSPPDFEITADTKIGLWTTDGIDSTAIHVDTDDGRITLYGKVPDNDQKVRAEAFAGRCGTVIN